MLATGINQNKACMLIALDDMFEGTRIDWGKDFLEDYFLEFGNDGFDLDHSYLITESAPVIELRYGVFTSSWSQGDWYWQIIDDNNHIRYRVYKNTKVILVIHMTDGIHAVCIPAHTVNTYLRYFQFICVFLPAYGMIIDKA